MTIVIVAIICWTIVTIAENKKWTKKSNGGLSKAEADELMAKVAQLQDRVETLEKIVTDEKYDLNRQFDDLAKDSGRAA
ncbi:hypothetical protein KIU71_01100 [Alteromonas sp. SM 2104]|nr:hypothetical protein [Alteromonas oceanisediminis]MBT0584995.1 hypothetical protein [Alteromonas oceanisediminis]